nr:solute carrier family 40 member 2-like [Ipomoea batatas]
MVLICRVVVISEGHPPELQTNMNSIIRRIDLGCIISFISLTASAMALALWNMVSVCMEYWLLSSVSNGVPALRESSQKRALRSLPNSKEISPSVCHQEEERFLNSDRNSLMETSENSSCWGKIGGRVSTVPYISAWKVYLQQDVVLPGFALALLYFTILR